MLRSDPRIHYKMYKVKKNMVYAALFSFAVLGSLGLNQNAKADTVENTSTQPVVTAVGDSAATPQSTTNTVSSSAADVKTVSSASTAQPTSTQPVSNSNVVATSNAANQVQTTTFNIQSAQPAQTVAATSQANLYAQNLVETTSRQAQNVNLTADRDDPSTTYSVPVGNDKAWNLKGDFTVSADQMKAGQDITVAHISQQAADGSNASSNPRFNVPTDFHIYKNDIDCGTLYESSDFQTLLFRPNTTADVVGDQALHFDVQGGLFLSWQPSASAIKKIPQTIQYNVGNLTFNVTYTAPTEVHRTQGQDGGFVDANNADASLGYLAIATQTPDDYAKLLQSGGTANVALKSNYNYGVHISSDHPLYKVVNAYNLIPTTDIDPTTHQAYLSGMVQEYQTQKLTQTADNLSLQQLKSSYTQPGAFYSRQSDGSINVWVNTPLSSAMQSSDQIKQMVKQTYYPLVHNLNADKVADATADYIQNGGFHGLPVDYYGQYFYLSPVDPSIQTHISATFYNDDLQRVNGSTAVTKPASSMAHGQAAVKLHVINATNGTELNQSSKLIDEARNKKNSSQ